MKAVLVTVCGLFLFCAACHRSQTDANQNSGTPAAFLAVGGASISASPNPVMHGPEEGTTTITWDDNNQGAADVYVVHNGAAEQLLASAPSGSKTVKWIRAGSTYEFLLYQKPSHKLLAKVQVTHKK